MAKAFSKILGARATVTSKGQVTIPKVFRERYGIKSGVELQFSVDPWDHIVVTPLTGRLEDLMGILPKPERALTIEEIDEAIAQAAVERVTRSS